MQQERVQELLALLMERGLDEAGQRELAAHFEANPKSAGEALDLWLQEARIRWVLSGGADPEANVERVLDALRSSLPKAESHVQSVLARVGGPSAKRASRRRFLGRPKASWGVPAALAACGVLGIALWIALSPSRSGQLITRPESGASKGQALERGEEPKNVADAPAPPRPEPKETPRQTPPPKPQEPKREELTPKIEEAAKPSPRPDPAPVEGPKAPEKPTPPSATALATLDRVEGEVLVVGQRGKTPAKGGEPLLAGEGLEVGRASRAILKFADGTRVDVGPETRVKEFTDTSGKRAQVERGRLSADVTRQPPGKPMVFATPQGEATVLGTSLQITVDALSVRLEVTEGKVRLKRLSDGKTVEVVAGHFAVAGVGIDLAPKLMPVDEIVLGISQGTIAGREWRRVKDERAPSGEAFEALDTAAPMPKVPVTSPDEQQAALRARQEWFAKGRSRSWVAFTFHAEADKEYSVWVRGECRWAGKDRGLHDAVMMQVRNGRFLNRPKDWPEYPDEFQVFGGYADHEGYWWSGGQNETGWAMTPISVRFNAPGRQTLLMHAAETPMRVDAIWISATQRTRPDAKDGGPVRR